VSSSQKSDAEQSDGVLFPLVDGRRSTQTTAKAVFAEAARGVAPDVAESIERSANWHKDYVAHLSTLERVSALSPKSALAVAADGLFALHERMVFARDGEQMSLSQALDRFDTSPFETVTLEGRAPHPRRLTIPYRGQQLAGDSLHRQLDDWVRRGVIEPSCADALRTVDAQPDWLDAGDITVGLVGAAAEMSPLSALLSWGATVAAVDLPRPAVWERIVSAARDGSGRVLAPAAGDSIAGADLLTQLPEIRAWLTSLQTPLVLGNYAYADGAMFVRVAAAADALTASLAASGTARALAYLASPTDVFAVPMPVVQAARDGGDVKRRGRRIGGPVARADGLADVRAQLSRDRRGRGWPAVRPRRLRRAAARPQLRARQAVAALACGCSARVRRHLGERRAGDQDEARDEEPGAGGGVLRCAHLWRRCVRAGDEQHVDGCAAHPRPAQPEGRRASRHVADAPAGVVRRPGCARRSVATAMGAAFSAAAGGGRGPRPPLGRRRQRQELSRHVGTRTICHGVDHPK